MKNEHICSYRVYYEDTDAGGVVYYANYLKFAERARTEMLREKGVSQLDLAKNHNLLFVVKDSYMDIKKSAKLDDLLTVKTTIKEIRGARIIFFQELTIENQILSVITSTIAMVNTSFKPVKIPFFIKEKF